MKEVFEALSEKHIEATITDRAADELARLGYDPKFGARPLRKVIRQKIEDRLADMFLEGKLNGCKSIKIDFKKDEFVFDIVESEEALVVVVPDKKESK